MLRAGRVPKVYNGHDRTFFMFSWESYRDASGVNQVTLVPTALQRIGDFSQTIEAGGQHASLKNPFGTGVFAGAVIPSSLLNPISLKILPHWPTPNQAGANNYLAEVSSHSPWDSFMTRIDQRVTSKDTVSFRYPRKNNPGQVPFDGSALGTYGSVNNPITQLFGLNWVRVFSATVINEARAGLYRNTGMELPRTGGTTTRRTGALPASAVRTRFTRERP